MKITKKILSILLAVIAIFYLFSDFHVVTKDIAEAALRDKPAGDFTIILTPNVPLSGDLNGNISQEIFKQLNDYRVSKGLSPLSWSTELESAATVRATEAHTLWSHTRPNGTEYWTVNPDIVYGENLAKGYSNATEVMEAWKASPTHNDNLLYPDFRYVAIAKVDNYYSAEFCY